MARGFISCAYAACPLIKSDLRGRRTRRKELNPILNAAGKLFYRGNDEPGREALNERIVFHDLSGSECEGEGCSSCSPKARNV